MNPKNSTCFNIQFDMHSYAQLIFKCHWEESLLNTDHQFIHGLFCITDSKQTTPIVKVSELCHN